MVSLLVMQFAENLFSIFARIGYTIEDSDIFISDDAVSVASKLSYEGLDAFLDRFSTDPNVEIGDIKFPIMSIDYASV